MKNRQTGPTLKMVGGDIPEELVERFDETVRELGFLKKRAMAAALAAFVHLDTTTQSRLYHDVYLRYYAQAQGDASSTKSQAARQLAQDAQHALEKARRSAGE